MKAVRVSRGRRGSFVQARSVIVGEGGGLVRLGRALSSAPVCGNVP